MKQVLYSLLLLGGIVQAADNCVLQDRTVSQSHVVIQERSPIRKSVVPAPNGLRKCVVDFRVRIGADWHTTFGEHTWLGDRPESEACAIAASRAEDAVRQRIGRSQTASEKILICKDEPALTTLRNTVIGTVGNIAQFRPHPDYPNRFYHNGAQCRWFVDVMFTGRDVRTFQGIICEMQDQLWVVVDKF